VHDVSFFCMQYDWVVIGTGLVESLVSGALSRSHSVLHVDLADKYGGQCCALSGKDLAQMSTGGSLELTTEVSQSKGFCIEKSTKIIKSRGEMVELIISSGAASCVEFKLIENLYVLLNGSLEHVPGCKEDIFANEKLNLIQKRLLMKFLTTALDYQNHPDWYLEHCNMLFIDFLKAQKLDDSVCSAISHGLVGDYLLGSKLSTIEGLARLHSVLKSAGRYGKGSFLIAHYGTGSELCQAFCRYSATYGTCFMLDVSVEFIKNVNGQIEVSINGDTYTASKLLLATDYINLLGSNQPELKPSYIHHSISISKTGKLTDSSVLVVPPNPTLNLNGMLCVQTSFNTYTCPEGFYCLTVSSDGGENETNQIDDTIFFSDSGKNI
jgi:RAB protein geranylgeranyltransferase component A